MYDNHVQTMLLLLLLLLRVLLLLGQIRNVVFVFDGLLIDVLELILKHDEGDQILHQSLVSL